MGNGITLERRCESGVAFLKRDIAFHTFLADIYREKVEIGWGVFRESDTLNKKSAPVDAEILDSIF